MAKACRFQINGDATQLTSSMSLDSRKILAKAESLSYKSVILHGPVWINNQSRVNLLALIPLNSVASHVCIAPSIEQEQGQGQQQPEMESTGRPVSWIS